MACQAGTPVDVELKSAFAQANSPSSDLKSRRIFKVQIQNDILKLTECKDGVGDTKKDFDMMQTMVNETEACFFLFKLELNKWLFVKYVPSGVKIKDRMQYASSEDTLKRDLGVKFIGDEIHATNRDELSYSTYMGYHLNKDDESYKIGHSESEKALFKARQMEDIARKEMMSSGTPVGGKMTSLGSSVATASNAGGPNVVSGGRSSGYHSVPVNLSASAKSDLEKMKTGAADWVALEINPDSKENEVRSCGCLTKAQIGSKTLGELMIPNEPRFYFYRYSPSQIVFIYCCPENSPPKLRMVYSTAKPSIVHAVKQHVGIALAKKFELNSSKDFSERFIREELTPSHVSTGVGRGGGAQRPSTQLNVIQQAHPVYSLMAPADSKGAGVKKKIVVPPPGAYC